MLILVILVVPLWYNIRSRNICDMKDVLLGVGAALGLAIWLVASLARGRVSWLSSRLNLAIFAFTAWAAVSILYSRYRYVTISEFGRLAGNVALFWLAIASLRNLRQVRWVLGASAGLAIPVAIYGFCQATGHDFVRWSEPVIRIFSFLGNPTYLAGFLILVIPLALAAAWIWLKSEPGESQTRKAWTSYLGLAFFLGATVLMLFCLYLSVTLAGAIGLGLGAVLTLILVIARGAWRTARRVAPGLAVALILLAPVAYLGYRHLPRNEQERVQQVLRFQDPYGRERRLHWKTALDIFKARPLVGEGYGAFRVYSLERMAPEWYIQGGARRAEKMLMAGYAHNEYLQILADVGVVGALLFLVVILGGYGLAIWVGVKHPTPAWSALGLAGSAAMTAFFFQNFFGVTFRQAGAVTFFWLWLALVVLARALMPRPGQELGGPRLREFRFRPVPIWGLTSIGLGLAFSLVVLSWVAMKPVLASQEVRAAQSLAAGGRYREAAELADHALGLCPYSSVGYYTSGYAWGQVGEFDKAIAANRRALELMPGNASVYYNLAVSYKQKGQWPEAFANMQRAIELMPTAFRHQAAMAEMLLEQGRASEAEPHAREALRLGSDKPEDNLQIHLLLANILGKQNRLPELAVELLETSRLFPANAKVKQELVNLLFHLKDYPRLFAVSEEWMRQDPRSPVPHNALGTYYFNKGDYQEAKKRFLRAVELDPTDWRARLNLAYAHGRLREFPAAASELEYLVTHAGNTPEGKAARVTLTEMRRAGAPPPR